MLYRQVGEMAWRARWFARPFVTLTEVSFRWGPPCGDYSFRESKP